MTRDRPWAALLVASDAVDEACEAVCLAASAAFVDVDSKRTMWRPMARPDRLMTSEKDIFGWMDVENRDLRRREIRRRAERRREGGEVRPKSNWGEVAAGGERAGFGEGNDIAHTGTRWGRKIEKNWKAREISKGVGCCHCSARGRPIRGPN